eukprot:SAG11_NODE_28587_length_320_cov_0.384615_1_plen_59_part_10
MAELTVEVRPTVKPIRPAVGARGGRPRHWGPGHVRRSSQILANPMEEVPGQQAVGQRVL